jgi:hypothetical protein
MGPARRFIAAGLDHAGLEGVRFVMKEGRVYRED